MQTTIATNVSVLGLTPRITSLHLPWKSREALESPIGPGAMMSEFERQYDELVDLLCWSAKEDIQGDHAGRDERYLSLRAWFLANYEQVRPYLLKHLTVEPEDIAPAAPGQPAPRDAFESLFLQRSVDALINSETVIFRIIRTRSAVEAFRNEGTGLRR